MQRVRKHLASLLLRQSYLTRGPDEEPFTLASGKTSREYFDCKRTSLAPEGLQYIAEFFNQSLMQIVEEDATKGLGGLAAVPLGGIPLAVATMLEHHRPLPLVVLRSPKDHGTGVSLEHGAGVKKELPLVLIEDVVTSGGSTIRAAVQLREAGFQVDHVLCVLDREAGGGYALRDKGLRLDSLFTISELREMWEELQDAHI